RWPVSSSVMLALRWLLVASFAAVAVPIIFRERIARACGQLRWPQMEERSKGLASLARAASLALFAVPALGLTRISFLGALIAGDSTGEVRLLAPLAVVSLTLAAHAVRERSPGYAFASGLTINLATTLGCVMRGAEPMTVVQANLIAAALFALVWLEVSRRLA